MQSAGVNAWLVRAHLKTHVNTVLLFLSVARRVRKVRFQGKYRPINTRQRWVVSYRRRKYQIRGFRRGRLSISVLRRPRPIIRKGRYWYITFGRRKIRVRRRGRRRYIILNRKRIYLRWIFKIRFKGVRRVVRCRRRKWSMRYGSKWRGIRKQRVRYIKVGRRRYPVMKRINRYRVRIARKWTRVKAKRRRRRGGRRRK